MTERIKLLVKETPKKEKAWKFQEKIKEKIDKTYEKEINDNLNSRVCCRRAGHILEGVAQVFSVSATIMAFASGFYNNKMLSFISGCLGSMALAVQKTSAFTLKESKERTIALNILLKKINIDTLPEIVEEE